MPSGCPDDTLIKGADSTVETAETPEAVGTEIETTVVSACNLTYAIERVSVGVDTVIAFHKATE